MSRSDPDLPAILDRVAMEIPALCGICLKVLQMDAEGEAFSKMRMNALNILINLVSCSYDELKKLYA